MRKDYLMPLILTVFAAGLAAAPINADEIAPSKENVRTD